jgi:hypothetical protein
MEPTNGRDRVGRHERGRLAPPSKTLDQPVLRACRCAPRGAPRFLRDVLGLLRALAGHALCLLVHALALHRVVAGGVTRGLLASAEQLVEETHP